ncbi:hypothetical protein L226DRAFT_569448 [Lentinus tigrinus ALCF2SS1-7]|uniref:uncharacterized protein n=1 Tax=Lentinus tigrinus ALCF2SS1-7 TaxID=1328758 RepID=UPI001165CA99|nr:hypothetical protein L226DRAFT_569448 [Lentinus tigrinus ALCF2SS1-7]
MKSFPTRSPASLVHPVLAHSALLALLQPGPRLLSPTTALRSTDIAGYLWNQLSPTERASYHAKIDEPERMHATSYPNHNYPLVHQKDRGVNRQPKLAHSEKIHRRQELNTSKRVITGNDHYDCDDSHEYVKCSRRKMPCKFSANKVMEPPHPRPARVGSGQVKFDQHHDQDVVASPAISCPTRFDS